MSHPIVVPAVVAAALFTCAPSCQATPPSAERPVALPVHVALVPPVPGSPRQLRAMMQEVEAVWHSYDVRLIWLTPGNTGSMPRSDMLLQVKFVHAVPSTRPRGASSGPGLGAIEFFEGDRPDDTIILLIDEIAARVLSVKVDGRGSDAWPQALADDCMGRARGRVLAHELGHYLLASRAHSRNGLMRPAFGSQELAGWDRRGFRLDAAGLLRLRARLTASGRHGALPDFG